MTLTQDAVIVVHSETFCVFSIRDDGHVKWLDPESDSPSRALFDSGDDARVCIAFHAPAAVGKGIYRQVPPRAAGTFWTRPKTVAAVPGASATPGPAAPPVSVAARIAHTWCR